MTTKRKVTIGETEDGWISSGKTYPTAAQALRAITQHDKESAGSDGIAITVIEWRATTRIGKIVVSAITGK